MSLQRAAGNAAVARLLGGGRSPVLDVVGRGTGLPVDDRVLSEMEYAFGQDFSDVRVHTGPLASESAASVQASAFTVGNEIVFADSQFSPTTAGGQRLLAHELSHVVQQRQGPVDGTPWAGGIAVSDPSDRFERAAEIEADRAIATLAAPREHADQDQTTRASALPQSVVQRARSGRRGGVTVQRNEESERILKQLATPQVKEGPAIEIQKRLIEELEDRVPKIIKADLAKEAQSQTEIEAWRVKHDAWSEGWKWIRGAEPQAPTAPFGSGKRLQLNEDRASEFNLGGILIDSLPQQQDRDVQGQYEALGRATKVVPLDGRVTGARSSGFVLPELTDGLGPLVAENTLKTMIDAGQLKYLRAAGLPNAQWKILAEVHYVRARPKDMAGFHKDTQGQTLFVNLNYHVGDRQVRGPEYVLNPPTSTKHDERIFGTQQNAGTLPKEFTADLTKVRDQLGNPTHIMSAGTVQPYGYVAFVDEAIHHATPWFGGRYITPLDLKGFLERVAPAKLNEIVRAQGNVEDVNTSIINREAITSWNTWREMIDNPTATAKYTRTDFAGSMSNDEFDLMLENVGAQPNAARQKGGAGGWLEASIPSDGRSPVHGNEKEKRPLIRQASLPNLTQNWPEQLPDDVPRRFLRTWVRAVPEATAAKLRNL
jgi:hypothetical protein